MRISGNGIKKLKEADAEKLFDQTHLVLAAKSSILVVRFLKEKIAIIEKKEYFFYRRGVFSLPARRHFGGTRPLMGNL